MLLITMGEHSVEVTGQVLMNHTMVSYILRRYA